MRAPLARWATFLVSIGRPGLATVSLPTAPLASRLVAGQRVAEVVRRAPWVALLAGEVAFATSVLTGLRAEGKPVGSVVVALFVLLLQASLTYVLANTVRRSLDELHAALLGRLRGVYVLARRGAERNPFAELLSLRTPNSDAFVTRAFEESEDAEGDSSPSNGRVVDVLTKGGSGSLVAAAHRGRDDGLVEDVLRLSLLLPLGANYDAVTGVGTDDRASLEARHDDVRRFLADVDSGVPPEWALRRAATRGAGS